MYGFGTWGWGGEILGGKISQSRVIRTFVKPCTRYKLDLTPATHLFSGYFVEGLADIHNLLLVVLKVSWRPVPRVPRGLGRLETPTLVH